MPSDTSELDQNDSHSPPTPEPVFEVYRKDQNPEIGDPPYDLSEIDLESLSPNQQFTGWDALMEFLDNTEVDYVWREINIESAPEIPLCPDDELCNKGVVTWSKERLESVRANHHIGSGH